MDPTHSGASPCCSRWLKKKDCSSLSRWEQSGNHFQAFLPVPSPLQKVFVGDFIPSPYSRDSQGRVWGCCCQFLIILFVFVLTCLGQCDVCVDLFYCPSQPGFRVGAPIAGERGQPVFDPGSSWLQRLWKREIREAKWSCGVHGHRDSRKHFTSGHCTSRPCLCYSNRMFLCSLEHRQSRTSLLPVCQEKCRPFARHFPKQD